MSEETTPTATSMQAIQPRLPSKRLRKRVSSDVTSHSSLAKRTPLAGRVALPVSGSDRPAIAVVVPSPRSALRFRWNPGFRIASDTGSSVDIRVQHLGAGVMPLDIALPKPASVAIDERRERTGILVIAFPAPATGRPGPVIFDPHASKRARHALVPDYAVHHVQSVGMGIVHFDIADRTHGAEAYRGLRRNGRNATYESTVSIAASARKACRETKDDLAVNVVAAALRARLLQARYGLEQENEHKQFQELRHLVHRGHLSTCTYDTLNIKLHCSIIDVSRELARESFFINRYTDVFIAF